MNRTGSTVLHAFVAVLGLLFSIVVLSLGLVSTQASSGLEPFTESLSFFAPSFALAFGLGAACSLPLGGRYRFGPTALAFATGGALGGAILAGSLQLVHQFEPLLRRITSGGPIGIFLLAGVALALATPIPVGIWLLRKFTVTPTATRSREEDAPHDVSTQVSERSTASDLIAHVLRSITWWTGALAGGLGVAVPILAATYYELNFGRPSSTTGAAIPFGIVAGAGAAAMGAALGEGFHRIVARTRWAGHVDRRVAGLLVLLVVAVPSVSAVQAVRRADAADHPRVIRSSGELVPTPGSTRLIPQREATLLWHIASHPVHPTGEVQWNARRVHVRVADRRLLVTADHVPAASIDLRGFDYTREAYGVTAALSEHGREWLALLLQLRAGSRCDLLFIFNPNGVLVHEQLLERGAAAPRVGLAAAGSSGGPQEIVVDRGGPPIRYSVAARSGPADD